MSRLHCIAALITTAVYAFAGLALCCTGNAMRTQTPSLTTPPPMPREFRGVWVATVANIDWPTKRGEPSDDQKLQLTRILDKAAELHMNAVVLQVRPACDALYKSKIEPWSEFLTGKMGQPPVPEYDPLQFAVTQAHLRGLELHAWFNPYRAHHPAGISPISAGHISHTHPEMVKSYGGYLWLDPGQKRVRDYTMRVIMDVVKRYDVDGVQIDDYFYPYPVGDKSGIKEEFPDAETYKAYRKHGGKLARDDWRRNNVDLLIQQLYKQVKAAKPWVKVGISPFGIPRPGIPPGITGMDQYTALYSDVARWLHNGWADYFAPQLYWKLTSQGQNYVKLLQWWLAENTQGRHIWPGNFTSMVDTSWSPQEIIDQVSATRALGGADTSGNIQFSMVTLMRDARGVSRMLLQHAYAAPAVVPACPWLGRSTPLAPEVKISNGDHGTLNVAVTPAEDHAPGSWIVQWRTAKAWGSKVVWGTETQCTLPASDAKGCSEVAVTAVDKFGNAGKATCVAVP